MYSIVGSRCERRGYRSTANGSAGTLLHRHGLDKSPPPARTERRRVRCHSRFDERPYRRAVENPQRLKYHVPHLAAGALKNPTRVRQFCTTREEEADPPRVQGDGEDDLRRSLCRTERQSERVVVVVHQFECTREQSSDLCARGPAGARHVRTAPGKEIRQLPLGRLLHHSCPYSCPPGLPSLNGAGSGGVRFPTTWPVGRPLPTGPSQAA